MPRAELARVLPALLLLAGAGCGTVYVDPEAGEVPPGPPSIVATEQSSLSAAPGQVVTFAVEAVDPQDSPLTFTWEASLGTLGEAESTGTTSRVPWSTPTCVNAEAEVEPTITVTVTNELDLSATASFLLGGLKTCTVMVWSTGGEVDTVVVPEGKTSVELLVWGAGGGGGAPGPGGGGGWVSVNLAVTPGDLLEVRVGSGGDASGGGGGASYVLRNGEIVLVAGGGGGGGVDGCSGCSMEADALAGTGGAGGPAGGDGQDGRPNDYVQTGSGAGGGGKQDAGGVAGISDDQNPYGYNQCTSNGAPGQESQGGGALLCDSGAPPPAVGHIGGGGLGNGSGGGGGSGWFGGGSGASKYTYSGGGGGGGSSWIHASATLLATEGGDLQAPGGQSAPDYQGNAGRGGDPETEPFGEPAKPGAAGLIVLKI